MNELQSIDKLTKASIELSEAAANYGALKVIFGVFMVVFLLMFLVFVIQIGITLKRLKKIEDASEKTLEYFSELNNHTVGKEEAKMIVRENLSKSEALMKYYILKMRLENHLSDKSFTEDKIRNLVDNDFSSRRVFLSRFLCIGHPVSFTATVEDNGAITKLIKDWVYKPDESFTVSLMAQAVSLYYDGLKINAQGKIDEVSDNLL